MMIKDDIIKLKSQWRYTMQINQFKELYQRNKINHEQFDFAVQLLEAFEKDIKVSIDEATIEMLDRFILDLVNRNQMDIATIVVFMRYYRMIKQNELFIHLTKYTGGLGVIESILERLEKFIGPEKSKVIADQVKIPVLGTPPNQLPEFTAAFINLLEKSLDEVTLKRVLAGNHHQIPESVFLIERTYYEDAETFDQYLKDLHDRKVKELEKHLQDGTVWFEQNITQEVVDFVKSNQEILSAVRSGDTLFITKIPYDVEAYLKTEDPIEKSYNACHCPFVKEGIGKHKNHISDTWCNCSAGFTKFPFEVLFNTELKTTVLENAIRGDLLCRFSVSLEGVDYKK